METPEQPRKLGSLLVVIAVIAAVAVVWATVALASGSSSGSSTPVASYDGGPQLVVAGDGTRRDCPDHDGGWTAPSTPSVPSAGPTTDGSTDPTL